MDRINKLCAYLEKCETFADIGCDHGYCTLYMLENNLCKRAVISDVSSKCLAKAERLLKDYIEEGRAASVCCFGLDEVDENIELTLIAGMGGEEIVSILERSFIPRNFVFQPIKNCRAVREYLLNSGAEITEDEVFESGGKFYFVIKGKRSGNNRNYSEAELEYGTSTETETCRRFLLNELSKREEYLSRPLNSSARREIERQLELIKSVLK